MEKFDVPVPVQEKIGRYLTWGVIGAAAVVGGNFLLPHVNTFLGLVQTALATTTNIVLSALGLMVLSYLALTFAPMIKQGIDVFAERATWALVNADPVGHLRIWLKEVRADKQEFANQLEGIGQAIATVESSMGKANDAATTAQNRYNSAMKNGKSDTQTYSVAAGKYSESVKRYEKMLGPLKMLERELQKLYEVYEREEFSLATDIDIQSKEWEVAQRAGAALDSAFRFLTKKSKKQVFAEQASKVISDRYASQFGRLRTLKNMSHDLIETFDLETGEYDAIAYEKWQQQSSLVIDNRSGKLEQVPMATIQAAQPLPRF
jgi:hypothetical protein